MQQAIIAGTLSHEEYIRQTEWLKGADYVVRANEWLQMQIAADTREHTELAPA